MNLSENAAERQSFGDLIARSGGKTANALHVVKTEPASAFAVPFLKALDATGWHNLVALDPSRDHGAPVDARTFAPGEFDAIARWVDGHDGRLNMYYTANEPKPNSPQKKLAKDDIAAIRAVYADIDLPANVPVDAGLADLQKSLGALELNAAPPTFRVDSGGGIQLLWKLDEKYDAAAFRDWAEGQGRALAALVEGDAVQNIDTLLRLPGTVNIPTPAKVAKGRVKRRSGVLASHVDRVYASTKLSSAFPPIGSPASMTDIAGEVAAAFETIDMREVESCGRYDELPAHLRGRFDAALSARPKLAALWRGDASALLGADRTSSAWRAALAAHLSTVEGFDAQDYGSLVWVWDQADRAKIDHRQLARDWAKYGAPNVSRREAVLAHFEHVEDALPPASGWIDPTQWDGKPIPPRQWEVEGWIPRGEVTLLYGDGGVGKSLLAHQYATAAATGRSWLGQKTRPGRVMCFMCEDSADELQRRQADINGVLHVAHTELGNLRLQSRKHSDNALGVWDRSAGTLKLTPAWHQLKRDAVDFGADVVVIDTLSDVFVGDEINRTQVNAFVKVCLGRLAAAFGGSVIALGHPSVAGRNSGTGTSGSTAWSNAVRSRLYLRYPDRSERGNIRELEGMKLNYGPKGSLLKIKWSRGAFDVVAGKVTASDTATGWPATSIPALDDAAEAATLAALNECVGTALSPAPNSAHYTPKVLKRRVPEELQAYSIEEIGEAVARLERKNLIRQDVVGKSPSRHPIKGYVVLPAKTSDEIKASVFA